MKFRYIIPLLIFFGLTIFLAAGLKNDPSKLPSALIDKPLPPFELPNLDDTMLVKSTDWYGEVALINIWGSWCAPCREEHPLLLAIAQEGVPIYGVNYKDNPKAAMNWLIEFASPYKMIIRDDTGKLGIDLGVYGVPETFILDKKGIIRYKWVGILTEKAWLEELRPIVEKLRAE